MTRRELLLAAIAGRPEPSLRRAAAWLWRRQSRDGGWHSETYGLLRSGQSLTPFVLEALLRLPDPPRPGVERAVAFLARHTDREGALGRANPLLPDYPNYATALAVLALRRLGRDVSAHLRYLRGQQFTEQNGWTRDHPAYGAWGMGGDRRTPPDAGHVDLSMTRYVLQSLQDPVAGRRARVFLERLQNPDGGFCFSTVVLDANKAGEGRSYGSATADGILALEAVGLSADRARLWLAANHRTDAVPGFSPARRSFAQGLRFYYAAACAEAAPDLPVAALLGPQRPDGSFANPQPLVKEDDPLIATAFAVRALLARAASGT